LAGAVSLGARSPGAGSSGSGSAAAGSEDAASLSTGPSGGYPIDDASSAAVPDVPNIYHPYVSEAGCPAIPATDPGTPAGDCALVGVWALNGPGGTGFIEFGTDGAYYGGGIPTNLAQSYAYDGAYTVAATDDGGVIGACTGGQCGPASLFHLRYSCGDGCNGEGIFTLQFQTGCAIAFMVETITNCTGTRHSLADQVVLVRQ
jgi:hypothetical protein